MMDSLNNKAALLEEILKIDDEIKQLKTDTTYLKIRRNLKKLENIGFGNQIVTTQSPDDLDVNMKVPKRSRELKEIIQKYRDLRLEYEDKLRRLYGQKSRLEKRLFG
jgi:hypothetical protein